MNILNNIIVSVVIPSHNSENTIARTIDSVLSQTIVDIEVMVVDNNSSPEDATQSIIESYQDKRLNFFKLQNCSNANQARNFGTKQSTGEYVAYLDSDDTWTPNHLNDHITHLQSNNNSACYSGAQINRGKSLIQVKSRAIEEHENPVQFLIGKNSALAQTSTYVLKRTLALEVLWDSTLKRHQDYDFFIRVHKQSPWSFVSSITTTIYWAAGESRNHNFDSYIAFYQQYKAELDKEDRARYLYSKYKDAVITKADSNTLRFYQHEISAVKQHMPLIKRLLLLHHSFLYLSWYISELK